MKLFGSLTSPYVRKVRIVLQEKKIEHEFIIDIPWEEDSEVPKLNPLGKVPVLITDDGMVLFDSAVIVDFLEFATPNNRLVPQANRFRAMVKCGEALADGICDAGAAIMLEKTMHPSRQVSKELVGRNTDKIHRSLALLAEELDEKNYLFEDNYSLGDIAAGCALTMMDVLNSRGILNYDWRAEFPNLSEYLERLNTRQSFIDTAPPPPEEA